jgi:large subunit ribosomal protein L11
MATETVEVLIEGGKATAAPPLGPALGPLGVNIGQVVSEINKKTQEFKGMQVPVKVTVTKETKAFTISIGTPPASQLLIKEAGIAKASGNPKTDFVADLKIEQIIKVSKMKEDALLGKTSKERVKEIMGTCQSMGIMVEGKPVIQSMKDVSAGVFDDKISKGKTELSSEELKELAEEKKRLQKDLEEKRVEFTNRAKSIMSSLEGKPRKEIEAAMIAAGVPSPIIREILPEEKKDEPAKGGAKK